MALEESFDFNTGWVHDLRCALHKLGSSKNLNILEAVDVEGIMSEVFGGLSTQVTPMQVETSLMREGLALNASDTRNGSQPIIMMRMA